MAKHYRIDGAQLKRVRFPRLRENWPVIPGLVLWLASVGALAYSWSTR